jgi:hypothetical protein
MHLPMTSGSGPLGWLTCPASSAVSADTSRHTRSLSRFAGLDKPDGDLDVIPPISVAAGDFGKSLDLSRRLDLDQARCAAGLLNTTTVMP